jgi:DNA polymerase III delta subunit
MVTASVSLYLLAGQDIPAKDAALEQIKAACLPAQQTRDFNLDIVHGRDMTVQSLQEKLLFLPLESGNRLVIIRHCQDLKADAKRFLVEYCGQPHPGITLVLDFDRYDQKEACIAALSSAGRLQVFKQEYSQNVFDLSRAIEAGKTAESLRILNHLLDKGEKPEMLLGGLRASLTRKVSPKKALTVNQLLLQCDVTVKTGSLKPLFALERLIVSLCGLRGDPNR